jgi:hypothetical protein
MQVESNESSKRKWLVGALVLLVVLLYPFQTTVLPEQRVLVVNQDMRPIKGVLVRQIWQHYSLERRGHEEDLLTDIGGRVTFAKRTIRSNLVWRILGQVVNIVTQGVHASFGIHTNMLVLGEGTETGAHAVSSQPDDIVYRLRR